MSVSMSFQYISAIFHRNELKFGMMTLWMVQIEPKGKKKFKLRLVAPITYYVSQSVFPKYISHFSSEWTEIWHADSVDGIDQV